jgi:hypothetical protein
VVNAPDNPFHSGLKVSLGRPDIKPVKVSSLPDPTRVVSEMALPPKKLEAKVKTFQHRTPAVRKDVSVFHPGNPVQPLRIEKNDQPQPTISVRRHEVMQPPEHKEGVAKQPQKEEKNKTTLRREEVKRPTIQRQETNRPSVSSTVIPPAQKREAAAPVMKKLQTNNFTEKRREVAPPTVRRETRPAPQFTEKPSLRSGNRTEMNPPSNRSEVKRSSIQRVEKPRVLKSEMQRSSVRR